MGCGSGFSIGVELSLVFLKKFAKFKDAAKPVECSMVKRKVEKLKSSVDASNSTRSLKCNWVQLVPMWYQGHVSSDRG